MGDFFQNGVITTLPILGDMKTQELERELLTLSKRRNMVLLLPALYSEFETPAMHKIIEELKEVKYLYKIVLGLDRASKKQFQEVKKIMSQLPTDVRVIWNDGPRMQSLIKKFEEAGFSSVKYRGKGLNVWLMLGYILSDRDAYAIALHDCDIVNYSREVLARLLHPVVHPALDFEFNKGYYSRVTDKLHGRVTRLFYTPLIRSLEKIFGYNKYLNYMDSFRYALSGEFAFIRSLARGVRISPTWGLEVSTLSEVYTNTSFKRICQSEIMDTYEHKHQNLGEDAMKSGVIKMANEIAQTIFRVMAQEGFVFTEDIFKTLFATYFQESRYAISKSNALSLMNGLHYDRQKETEAVIAFNEALKVAAEKFREDPLGVPSLSAWISVRAVMPEISREFIEAVELDNEE